MTSLTPTQEEEQLTRMPLFLSCHLLCVSVRLLLQELYDAVEIEEDIEREDALSHVTAP